VSKNGKISIPFVFSRCLIFSLFLVFAILSTKWGL
jgi:hypothetical protein